MMVKLLFLLVLLPSLAFGQEKTVGQVVRSANAEITEYSDGTRHAIVSSVPRNYIDKQGKWQKIDTRIEADVIGEYTHTVYKVPYRVRFGNDGVYKFDYAGRYVIYRPENANSVLPVIEGNKATYYNLWTDTDVELIANSYGVKENIILKSDKAPMSFSFRIETSAVSNLQNKVVSFENGKFCIVAPTAFDSNENSLDVLVELKDNVYTVVIDVLSAEFPVILDPTTQVQGIIDGTQNSGNELVYATCRDKDSSAEVLTGELTIGQSKDASNRYRVYRAHSAFVIPSLISVESCSLYINGVQDLSVVDFEIYIHGAGSYKSTLTTADYTHFDGRQVGGVHNGTILNDTWDSSSFSYDWNIIVFNAAGRDSVVAVQGDTLWIALISKEDYNNSPPGNYDLRENVSFDSSLDAGTEPYISFAYTLPGWSHKINTVTNLGKFNTVAKASIKSINTVE